MIINGISKGFKPGEQQREILKRRFWTSVVTSTIFKISKYIIVY